MPFAFLHLFYLLVITSHVPFVIVSTFDNTSLTCLPHVPSNYGPSPPPSATHATHSCQMSSLSMTTFPMAQSYYPSKPMLRNLDPQAAHARQLVYPCMAYVQFCPLSLTSFISVDLLFPGQLAPLYPAYPAPGSGAAPAAAPVHSVPS